MAAVQVGLCTFSIFLFVLPPIDFPPPFDLPIPFLDFDYDLSCPLND